MVKVVIGILLALLFLSLLLNIKFLWGKRTDKQTARVVSVIDGDTFKVEGGKKIRLFGIDAPEMGRCLSEEAKNLLSELVSGKEVQLADQFPDIFNRSVANVFVGGKHINLLMVEKGMARPTYDPSPYLQKFKDSYALARTEKVGLGSGKCVVLKPIDANCSIKGNVGRDSRDRFYYPSDCLSYTSVRLDLSMEDRWFCSVDEATKAGFVLAETCQNR